MALGAVGLQTHIWNNQIKSVILLLGFPLLLLGMLFAFFTFMGAANVPPGKPAAGIALQAGMDGITHYGHWAFLAAGIWFAIAWLFHAQMINLATGAHPLSRKEEPKIYNMLENLCISRGIPTPKLNIIDSPQLNAFASGITDKSYTITLTRGIINALEDDELEAVIAHELSHIRHKDVRLLIISVIFVGMISFMAEMAYRSLMYGRPMRYGSDSHRRDGQAMIVALVVLGIGYLFAILIRFALSRKREYLADAGSVELTKNPSAMMRALMRISGKSEIQGMPADIKMMCVEHRGAAFLGMFATHPPIEKRIKIISEMTGEPLPTLASKQPPQAEETMKGPWSTPGVWK